MLYDAEQIPEQYKFDSKIEDLIFQATEESCEEATTLIKESNNKPINYYYSLIEKAAEVRPFAFKALSQAWKNLEPVEKKYQNTIFTEYLAKKQIISERMLTCQIKSTQTPEEIEMVFPRDSIQYSIANDLIDEVIFRSANVNLANAIAVVNGTKMNFLSLAAFCGSEKSFKYILANGASIDKEVIKNAIKGGNEEIIEIVEYSNLNLNNNYNAAIESHNDVIARWLYENYQCEKITIQKAVDSFNTPAFAAVSENTKNFISLMVPAANCQLTIIKELIKKGASVNERDEDGWSPLMKACENGQVEVVRELVDNGAEIEQRDNSDWTPLMIVSKIGQANVCKYLLEKNADVDAYDENGYNPILLAASNGHEDIINMLLDAHAKIESKDNCGLTPLTAAAKNGHLEAISVLAARGAQIDKKDEKNYTPLMHASLNGKEKVAELLINLGADIESKDKLGNTPLLLATMSHSLPLVKMLVENGANVSARNRYGETAAMISKDKEIKEYLNSL